MLHFSKFIPACFLALCTVAVSGCEGGKDSEETEASVTPLPPVAPPPSPTAPGKIVFSEIMANPAALADRDGEWFELANQGGSSIDLRNCVVADDSTVNFTIVDELIVDAGMFQTFANGPNPGFLPGFDYGASGMSLNNSDETLTLTCNGIVIDQIAYTASSSGRSFSLSGNGNANWCDDTVNDYGAGDTGTPGQPNIDCP